MEDWTEKYRPKTLRDIVGNDRAISTIYGPGRNDGTKEKSRRNEQ